MNHFPRPTEDDLQKVAVLAEAIDEGMAREYLQFIVEDGSLLELMRREKFKASPGNG